MKKLKVLDLFSGIGGFSLGLERTGGFETVAFCENAEAPRAILNKNWPNIPIFNDVERICGYALKDSVDVICGGFPCQDISSLNKKGKGLNGDRSGLWKEFHRLIKEIKPRYVIGENVTDLRSKGLTQIQKDLWSSGYDNEWYCIPASALDLPQERDRVWVIAYPASERTGEHEPRIWRQLKRENLQATIDSNTEVSRERLLDIAEKFGCEPTVQRSDYGISKRLDKLRGHMLGNAVAPQIPEAIGRSIINYELENT